MDKSSYQAKLFDAQRIFQRIICEQLHKLLASGRSPQAAYNVLIQRITQGKGCHDVSGVSHALFAGILFRRNSKETLQTNWIYVVIFWHAQFLPKHHDKQKHKKNENV